MDDRSLTPQASQLPAAGSRRRALWPLAAVAVVAILGAGAGAYFGLRGAKGPGSGPAAGPSARAFAAAAYDEAAHQVVLFGGMGGDGSALNDTWTWDGSGWTQQHPQTSPPARAFAAMAYDPKAHDVVLVGGRSSPKIAPPIVCSGSITAGGPNATPGTARPPSLAGTARPPSAPCAANAQQPTWYADTWLWDGGTWRLASQAPAQLPGQTPVLGTDPTTGQVLMLAMSLPATTPQLMCPVPVPPRPAGPPIAQPAIACGAMPSPTVLTWSWNGKGWTELPSVSPPSTLGAPYFGPGTLAADPASGHLMDVRSGFVPCAVAASAAVAAPCPLYTSGPVPAQLGAPSSSAGTGTASGPRATLATPPPDVPVPSSATPRPVPSGGAIATVPPSVQPGGTMQPAPMPGGGPLCCAASGSMTTWTGTAWKDATTFSNGPAVVSAMLAGDPAQHELVAYTSAGTWTWNGSAWKQQHPAAAPPAVQGGSLVYDGVSGKLLFFGGEVTSISHSSTPTSQVPTLPVSDELWAWDGFTWAQLSATKGAATPSPAATPAPTPTFVPPSTPRASASPSGSPTTPSSPTTAPCTPLPSPVPGKTTGTSTGPNVGCAVPSAAALAPG